MPRRPNFREDDVPGFWMSARAGSLHGKGRPASQRQRDDMIYLAHIRTAFELSNQNLRQPAHAP